MPTRRSAAAFTVFVAVSSGNATAQQDAWRVEGRNRLESFGDFLAVVGDVDGDGISDVAVSAVGSRSDSPRDADLIRILSGRDLRLIRELDLGTSNEVIGSLGKTGDFDGDGISDLVVGLPEVGFAGTVVVRSTASGATLATFASNEGEAILFGAAVRDLGDVDGDEVSDFAVGAPEDPAWSPDSDDPPVPYDDSELDHSGKIEIVSGATGKVLQVWTGTEKRIGTVPDLDFGTSALVDAIGDIDGDGARELVFAEVVQARKNPLRITVVPSSRQVAAFQFDGDYYGSETLLLRACGDVNGDQQEDIALVGDHDYTIYSSTDGTRLFQGPIPVPGRHSWLRVSALCAAGDLDQDGCGDLCMIVKYSESWGYVSYSAFVVSGCDGSTLAQSLIVRNSRNFGAAVGAIGDVDGDGTADLIYSGPALDGYDWSVGERGRAATFSAALGRELFSRSDSDMPDRCHAVVVTGDVDGDGIDDVRAVVETAGIDQLVTLSGADGDELRRWSPPDPVSYDGDLLRLPDVSGDGIGDYAISRVTDGIVEVRSGADDQLVRQFIDSRPGIRFGAALAVGQQPSGAIELAIGAPSVADGSKSDVGEIQVWNLGSGALVWSQLGTSKTEQLGSAIAYMGDVGKDGIGDWAVGAPWCDTFDTDAGRVAILSGKSGKLVKSILGARKTDRFGTAVAMVPDLGGDGVAELLVGEPFWGESQGKIHLITGGGVWTTKLVVTGSHYGDQIGSRFAVVPDANGDGAIELLTAGASYGPLVGYSSLDGRLLFRRTGGSLSLSATPPSAWGELPPGKAPSIVQIDPDVPTEVIKIEVTDLFLEIAPNPAHEDDVVTATLRGGPAGTSCGLYLDDIDDVPFQSFLAVGVLDFTGTWSTTDVVPPGLEGTVFTLRGFAVGFDGQLARSGTVDLAFQ